MKVSDSKLLNFKIFIEPQTLVFDLDETLIKATNDPSKLPDSIYDEKCHLDFQDLSKKNIYLSYRPFLFEMLG
jgi:hypothetical protein